MNETLKTLFDHRSIRKFQNDPVPDTHKHNIIHAAQAASTSSNVQAYSIINVSDPARRKKLAEWAGGQAYVAEAPWFVVWCADLYRLRELTTAQGVQAHSDTAENFVVATVDTALAAQNAAIAAESLGYGIVYIGGIRNQAQAVCELLELPELVFPLFGMCFGKPAQQIDLRPRLPQQAIYHENTYDLQTWQDTIPNYDELTKQYYTRRSGGKRIATWTDDMTAKMRSPSRDHMYELLQERGFIRR